MHKSRACNIFHIDDSFFLYFDKFSSDMRITFSFKIYALIAEYRKSALYSAICKKILNITIPKRTDEFFIGSYKEFTEFCSCTINKYLPL